MPKEPNARDAKLIQFLTEAYGKEKELETALEADIEMTEAKPYKKRLQDHLKITKAHARALERRIKQLGGKRDTIAEVGTAATQLASKARAAAKGPLHALRGTSDNEKQLKNAKDQLFNENEEIANYLAIEALAETVGDKETAKLARDHRRQEEQMAKYLQGQIPRLAKAVARSEVPAKERSTGTKRRRSSSRKSTARKTASSSSGSSSRSTPSKRSAAASKAATTRGARKTAATAKRTASSAKRTATSARKTASSARKTAASGGRAASKTVRRSAASTRGSKKS